VNTLYKADNNDDDDDINNNNNNNNVKQFDLSISSFLFTPRFLIQ